MRIHLGCEMIYDFVQPTPVIALLTVHASAAQRLEAPDVIQCDPPTPTRGYHDAFGNWCTRLMAPAGRFRLRVDGLIRDSGGSDPASPWARETPVDELPSDALQFLIGSRYCETDLMMKEAWRLFGKTAPGWGRVQAICDFVHDHVAFDYMQARSTRTAAETYAEGRGVCRDYAHLAVTLCRCLNIPARYCTGYISDIGLPPPYADMDLAAWIEVFLDGAWHVFDPRNNATRRGRVLIARGRDAADVPLAHIFGPTPLVAFKVWTDQVDEAGAIIPPAPLP